MLVVGFCCVTGLYSLWRLGHIRFLFSGSKNDLLEWYPHAGRSLYFILHHITFLRHGLWLVICAAFVIFIVQSIAAGRIFFKLPPQQKRYYEIRLAARVILSIPLLILGYVYYIRVYPTDCAIMKNDMVNQHNADYAGGNSMGFTDVEHSLAKPKGKFRIAVIGDSFIWGDGIPWETVWSHRLEQKLLNHYDSIEVLHWGRNGWSTKDEVDFFKQRGKDFNIDMLIIAWVDNDPDIGKWPKVDAIDVSAKHPVISFISPGLAQQKVSELENKNYDKWINRLYTPDNMREYGDLLKQFKDYLDSLHVVSLLVMTPGPPTNEIQSHFKQAEPVIKNSGMECLNLLPLVQKKFKGYSPGQLIANPVNGHPGELMTEEFANEVYDYISQSQYLQRVPKKH